MNNLGKFFTGIFTIAFAVMMIFAIKGCCEKQDERLEAEDQAWFNELKDSIAAEVFAPQITSIEDATIYQDHLTYTRHRDSIFTKMDPTVVAQITNVLLQQHGAIYVDDIVEEYKAHRKIYDNLIQPEVEYEKLTPPRQREPQIADTTLIGEE